MYEFTMESHTSKCTASLSTLPPEIQILIISLLDLATVVNVSQISSSFRTLCSISQEIWIEPLRRAAEQAGVYLLKPLPRSETPDQDSYSQIAKIGRSVLITSQVWIHLLPFLSRNFLLYSMELPYLSSNLWYQICSIRFRRSTMENEAKRMRVQSLNSFDSSWRGFFLKEISRLEHRAEQNCNHGEHFCQYLILHRNKEYGLTTDRIARRNFSPLEVYEEYKTQNGLSDRRSDLITIPRHLGPIDIEIQFYVSLGKEHSFLRNEVTMDILLSLGKWEYGRNTEAILGPSLITASVLPSPERYSLGRLYQHTYTSLQAQDLTDITPLTRGCKVQID